MLISVHLPKTAGTSFREELERQFGPRLLLDYERPMQRAAGVSRLRALAACAANLRRAFPGVDCIHGHFLPLKYALCGLRDGAAFITWMRDPVERLASAYYHWMREQDDQDRSAFRRRVVEERWPLERYLLCPERRNLYSRYLWGVPLRRFAFIGITEHYDADLERLAARHLPGPVGHLRRNVNPQREERYVRDPALRRRVEEYHRADVRLYRRALELRAERERAP